MSVLLVIAFLFFAGSLMGWGIEVLWRRFFSKNNPSRKWINPGFLIGPYLPLYGFSLVLLFSLSYIKIDFVKNEIFQKTILFIFMALCVTFVEYIAGLLFIKGMKIKLWDYSTCWMNFQGIICPMYTFFWYILSGLYYFFIHPKILNWLYWFTNHLTFSFFVGLFYGFFIIDVFYSFNLMNRIRKIASENKVIIQLSLLQSHIRVLNEERKAKLHFWLATKSEVLSLHESLKHFIEKLPGK